MNKQTKQVYQAPTITVVEMKVERGFLTSVNAGDPSDVLDKGTEQFDDPQATTGWF